MASSVSCFSYHYLNIRTHTSPLTLVAIYLIFNEWWWHYTENDSLITKENATLFSAQTPKSFLFLWSFYQVEVFSFILIQIHPFSPFTDLLRSNNCQITWWHAPNEFYLAKKEVECGIIIPHRVSITPLLTGTVSHLIMTVCGVFWWFPSCMFLSVSVQGSQSFWEKYILFPLKSLPAIFVWMSD